MPPNSTAAPLELSAQMLYSMCLHLPLPVSWVDTQLKYVLVNEALASAHGLSPADFIGRPFGFLRKDSEPDFRAHLETFFHSPHERYETRLEVDRENPLGSTHYLVSMQKIHDGQQVAIVGIDLTEQTRLEDALLREREHTLFTSKLATVGELAAGVAHEINNPLTVILAYVTKLKKLMNSEAASLSGAELSEKAIVSVEKIESMSARVAKLVRTLRNFSRDPEHDTVETIPVADILSNVEEMMKLRSDRTKIPVHFHLTNPEATIDAKQIQIEQILINLTNNAIDAAQETKSAWVRVECSVNGEDVYFTVTDSGAGIPEELHSKILQPFFTTKRANHGTGIGLSISKTLAEKNGGTLAYNALSANTQFVLTLRRQNRAAA